MKSLQAFKSHYNHFQGLSPLPVRTLRFPLHFLRSHPHSENPQKVTQCSGILPHSHRNPYRQHYSFCRCTFLCCSPHCNCRIRDRSAPLGQCNPSSKLASTSPLSFPTHTEEGQLSLQYSFR